MRVLHDFPRGLGVWRCAVAGLWGKTKLRGKKGDAMERNTPASAWKLRRGYRLRGWGSVNLAGEGDVVAALDLHRLADAPRGQAAAGFIAMGFEHQSQRLPQVAAAVLQRLPIGNCARDLLHPANEPSVAIRPEDGVETLLHEGH